MFFRYGILFIYLTVFTQSAWADFTYRYPGNPNCPSINTKHSWRDYISRKYPSGAAGQGEAFFTVKLDKDVGDISANRCHILFWNNGQWFLDEPTGSNVANGIDPRKYKLNIRGIVFTYDEAANIYYNRSKIGHMYCAIGNIC